MDGRGWGWGRGRGSWEEGGGGELVSACMGLSQEEEQGECSSRECGTAAHLARIGKRPEVEPPPHMVLHQHDASDRQKVCEPAGAEQHEGADREL